MIIDLFFSAINNFLAIILAPLEVINVVIDIAGSIPLLASFFQIVAYFFPWSNILPVIFATLVIMNFRNIIALITAIWKLIPFTSG